MVGMWTHAQGSCIDKYQRLLPDYQIPSFALIRRSQWDVLHFHLICLSVSLQSDAVIIFIRQRRPNHWNPFSNCSTQICKCHQSSGLTLPSVALRKPSVKWDCFLRFPRQRPRWKLTLPWISGRRRRYLAIEMERLWILKEEPLLRAAA